MVLLEDFQRDVTFVTFKLEPSLKNAEPVSWRLVDLLSVDVVGEIVT